MKVEGKCGALVFLATGALDLSNGATIGDHRLKQYELRDVDSDSGH